MAPSAMRAKAQRRPGLKDGGWIDNTEAARGVAIHAGRRMSLAAFVAQVAAPFRLDP
jgi:hypothetical protein